jgi:hypothetical protein
VIVVRSSIYKRFSGGGGFWEGGALELVKTDKEVGEGGGRGWRRAFDDYRIRSATHDLS